MIMQFRQEKEALSIVEEGDEDDSISSLVY